MVNVQQKIVMHKSFLYVLKMTFYSRYNIKMLMSMIVRRPGPTNTVTALFISSDRVKSASSCSTFLADNFSADNRYAERRSRSRSPLKNRRRLAKALYNSLAADGAAQQLTSTCPAQKAYAPYLVPFQFFAAPTISSDSNNVYSNM